MVTVSMPILMQGVKSETAATYIGARWRYQL